jgi:predicted ester cyclase
MTRLDIEQRLMDMRLAFEARDANALAMLHLPDGTFESPAHGVVTGRDAIRGVYEYWYGGFPDFTFTWDRPVIDPPYAAVFWTFEGTVAGPFFGDVKAGTHVRMKGAGEFTYSDAGIIAVRHIFDFSGLLVSAGVLRIKPAS